MLEDRHPSTTVDAVERAVTVIDELRELDGAGVTELADHLEMSKSGVHKQLSTLVKTGYVSKQDGEYHLSYRFLLMGEYVKTNSQLYQIGVDEVGKLADNSDYFAYLAAMDKDSAYCIYTEKGEDAVSPNLAVGNQISLHSSAAGKAILAELSEEKRSEVLSRPLVQKTEATVTNPDELRSELAAIHEEGVAFEDEEDIPGMRGVGAPILSESDTVVGAIAVSGPLSLFSEEHFREELPEMVRQAKNFIEVKLSLESREPMEEGSHIPENLY